MQLRAIHGRVLHGSCYLQFQCRFQSTAQIQNHYAVLRVKQTATTKEIKEAFYGLSKQYHPDVNKEKDSVAKFQAILEAYSVLGNEVSRREYNLKSKRRCIDDDLFERHPEFHRDHQSPKSRKPYSNYTFEEFQDLNSMNFRDFIEFQKAHRRKYSYANRARADPHRKYDEWYKEHYRDKAQEVKEWDESIDSMDVSQAGQRHRQRIQWMAHRHHSEHRHLQDRMVNWLFILFVFVVGFFTWTSSQLAKPGQYNFHDKPPNR